MKLHPSHENYPEDVTRIQTVVVDHGYTCSRKQADALWREYSDSMCAGWLILPDTETSIWECVESFIKCDDEA